MLVLLPPSESKLQVTAGPVLDFSDLSFSELTLARQKVAHALMETSKSSQALQTLKVGKSIAPTVAAQQKLLDLPCAPAGHLYTGVLYNALNYPTLSAPATDFTSTHFLIFSALFGVNKLTDLIPSYRLSMGVSLPLIGNTTSYWKQECTQLDSENLNNFNGLVIDCRSSSYQVWLPGTTRQYLAINAYREQAGKRSVISHNSKHYRGLLAYEIANAQALFTNVQEVAEFAQLLVEKKLVDAVELIPTRMQHTLSWQLALINQTNN